MHDTAFHIGTLAMNIYADLRTDSVLEVGSRAINGSLRESALPTTRYVGVDIEAGDGVDLVIEQGKPLPVEDDSFDLVMASSVFEHDPCFWMTFLEMCRATKDGGHIYINVPSNGVVHRYPQDNWRFYPDSGKALARWAASQGCAVTLVESFIAKRDRDIWNDFVAVFRKGPITRSLPKVFLHEQVPCSDIFTWKSKEIVEPSAQTEDLILLDQAGERARLAEEERDSLREEAAQLKVRLTTADDEHERQLAELGEVKGQLNLRESELRQRQEEIEQTRSQLAQARSNVDSLRAEISKSEERLKLESASRQKSESDLAHSRSELAARESDLAQARSKLAANETEMARVRTDLALLRAEALRVEAELDRTRTSLGSMEAVLAQSQAEKEAVQARLHEGIDELATLTKLLAASESLERQSSDEAEWLRETGSILVNGSTTLKGRLLSMMPAAFQQKRYRRLLKGKGLFDGEAYLAAHPDVAADGVDPLGHYLKHGMAERRRRA